MNTIVFLGLVAIVAAPVTARAADPDWKMVEQALGKSGQLQSGDVFRIGMPRTDLAVTVKGIPVKARFALGSYAAFKQALGRQGRDVGVGVFQVTVPRAESITEMGQPLLPAMGVAT